MLQIVFLIILVLFIGVYIYFKYISKTKDTTTEEEQENKKICVGKKTNIKREMYIAYLLNKSENINKKIVMYYEHQDKSIPVGICFDKDIIWTNTPFTIPVSNFTGFKFSKSETGDQNNIIIADSLALQYDVISFYNYYDSRNSFMVQCTSNNITGNRTPIIVKSNIEDKQDMLLVGNKTNIKRPMKIKSFIFDENKGKSITIYYNNENKQKVSGIEMDINIKLWNNFSVPLYLLNNFYSDFQISSDGINKHIIKLCDVTCDIGYENSFIINNYKDTDNVINISYNINGVNNLSEDLIVEQDYSLFSRKRLMTIKNFITTSNDGKLIELFFDNNDNPINVRFDNSIQLPNNFTTIDKLGEFVVTTSLNNSYTITYKNSEWSMVIEYYKNSFEFRVFFYRNNQEIFNSMLDIYDDYYYTIGNKKVHIIYKDSYNILDNSIIKEYDSCSIPSGITDEEKTQAENICFSNRIKTIISLETNNATFTDNDIETEIVRIPYTTMSLYDKNKIVEISSLIKNIIGIKLNYTLDEINNITILENNTISAIVPKTNRLPIEYTRHMLIKNFNNEDVTNQNKQIKVDYIQGKIPVRLYFENSIIWNQQIGDLKDFPISRIYKLQNSNDYLVRLFKLNSSEFIDFFYNDDLFNFEVNYKNTTSTNLEIYDTLYEDSSFVIFDNDYRILNNSIVRYKTSCVPLTSQVCNNYNYKIIFELIPELINFDPQSGNSYNLSVPFQTNNIFDRQYRSNILSLLKQLLAKYISSLISNVTNLQINYSDNIITANAPYKNLNPDIVTTRNMLIKNFGFTGNQNKIIKVYNTSQVNPNLDPVPFKIEFADDIILPSFASSERQILGKELVVFSIYNNNIVLTNIFGEGIVINNYGNNKYKFDIISNDPSLEGQTELEIYKTETLETGQIIIYKDDYELRDNKIILPAERCIGNNCSNDLSEYNKNVIIFKPKSNIFGGNLVRLNAIQNPLQDRGYIFMKYDLGMMYDENMINDIKNLIRMYFAGLFQLNPNYITNIIINKTESTITADSTNYCHYLRTENQCLGGQLWSVDIFNDPNTCVQGRYIGSC